MTKYTAEPGMPEAHLEARRARILDELDRPLEPIGSDLEPLDPGRVRYLREEAEELYWNELAWEELTEEERVPGGHLTELVFPGFLAFVDGLLLQSGPSISDQVPIPHPEVVESILLFLAERYAESTAALEQGADAEDLVWARAMTAQLIDLVLYRLYGLSPDERETLESGA